MALQSDGSLGKCQTWAFLGVFLVIKIYENIRDAKKQTIGGFVLFFFQNSKTVVPLMFANMGRRFFPRVHWEAGSWADAEDEAHPDRSTQKQEAWWPAVEAKWSLGKEGRSESDIFI